MCVCGCEFNYKFITYYYHSNGSNGCSKQFAFSGTWKGSSSLWIFDCESTTVFCCSLSLSSYHTIAATTANERRQPLIDRNEPQEVEVVTFFGIPHKHTRSQRFIISSTLHTRVRRLHSCEHLCHVFACDWNVILCVCLSVVLLVVHPNDLNDNFIILLYLFRVAIICDAKIVFRQTSQRYLLDLICAYQSRSAYHYRLFFFYCHYSAGQRRIA